MAVCVQLWQEQMGVSPCLSRDAALGISFLLHLFSSFCSNLSSPSVGFALVVISFSVLHLLETYFLTSMTSLLHNRFHKEAQPNLLQLCLSDLSFFIKNILF